MREPISSKTTDVNKPHQKTFRERWEADCRNFWIWTRCDNGHFTEVMIVCWALVIGLFMMVMATGGADDAPNTIVYWLLTAFLFAIAGILGIHVVM